MITFWEEVARDGAQAKTLLGRKERIEVAKKMSAIFGNAAQKSLIFAAGYPSICKEEAEIVEALAEEVDTCMLMTHGRMRKDDIDAGIAVMKKAAHGRVTFAVPFCEEDSQAMMGGSLDKTIEEALHLIDYAVDKSNGVLIDVTLGGASRTDPAIIADFCSKSVGRGIASLKLSDSSGFWHPYQVKKSVEAAVKACAGTQVQLGVHIHNDLGLALYNNLVAMAAGANYVSTSWLGLAERNGLCQTEALLYHLETQQDELVEGMGIPGSAFPAPGTLKTQDMRELSRYISKVLHVPIAPTTVIDSPNYDEIATGAYANDPAAFKAKGMDAVLGLHPHIVITHLVNSSLVAEHAKELGYELSKDQARAVMIAVKTLAYSKSQSRVSDEDFKKLIESELAK